MTRRILIAEDSPTQAEALSGVLEEAGYAVTVARDGEQALAAVAREPFDLVVSDIVMPGITGYELCRRIKVQLGRRAPPIMLLTSLSDAIDIVRGLECGADNFLTKPYEPGHLLNRVETVLRNREQKRTSRVEVGVTLDFLGSTFTITSDKEQILGLLVSTYEDAVLQNRRLRERETELQEARVALARYAGTLEERLGSILASVPDVLFSLSTDGRQVHYLSPATSLVFGYSPEELLANPAGWYARLFPEDLAELRASRERAAATGKLQTVQYRFRSPDESVRWIQTTYVPVADQGGVVIRLDGSSRDITQQHRLEEQVRLAQKMEAVGSLASGIAHDFNNLLGAIQGSADLALMDLPKESPVREEIGQIIQVADRAAALARQLLAFSRHQVLEPRALALNELVTGVGTMLRRVIGEDVELIVDLTPDPTTVMADRGQLEQVLMNLCVNARDAMPTGGEIAVHTERVLLDDDFCAVHPWAKPGDFVRITISDTGTGMDAATQARIFEPFFTTKERGRGTGLGLAMVYGIVKQHGGMIHVYSEPGRGTTFRLYFPSHAGTAEALAGAAETPLVGGSETVLVAEDEEVLRLTATKLLERLGYRVISAGNGQEALEILTARGREIQLVMLDVVMPGLGGVTVFERMQGRHTGLRFLFTTGYSPGTSHTAPLRTLPAAVLHKPYGLEALARAVRQALDGGKPLGHRAVEPEA